MLVVYYPSFDFLLSLEIVFKKSRKKKKDLITDQLSCSIIYKSVI